MRKFVVLAGTALLGACGGGATTLSSTPAPTPAPTTGTGSGTTTPTSSLVNPTTAKTYVGIGGEQVFEYSTYSDKNEQQIEAGQQKQKYSGNATTVRNSGISIAYDPRDAIFTLKVADALSGASTDVRFQDPASRTDYGGAVEPQWGTPQLVNPNVRYLQAGLGDPRSPYSASGTGTIIPGTKDRPVDATGSASYQAVSFAYVKPGTETTYSTIAAYALNSQTWNDTTLGSVDAREHTWHIERGAFAFGDLTNTSSVPKTGTGTYTGSMLATMVFNPTLDGQDPSGLANLATYFQWISGTSSAKVDFANSTFTLGLTGTVAAPQFDLYSETTLAPADSVIKAGATFTAAGKGTINMANFGGFKGAFDSASLTNPGGGLTYNVNVAGSSIDGAFYGPNGEELGGGFRIVGGNPDERVDIVGAYVGKK